MQNWQRFRAIDSTSSFRPYDYQTLNSDLILLKFQWRFRIGNHLILVHFCSVNSILRSNLLLTFQRRFRINNRFRVIPIYQSTNPTTSLPLQLSHTEPRLGVADLASSVRFLATSSHPLSWRSTLPFGPSKIWPRPRPVTLHLAPISFTAATPRLPGLRDAPLLSLQKTSRLKIGRFPSEGSSAARRKACNCPLPVLWLTSPNLE